MHFADDDRLCIPVPLYHCFGMVMGTLGCVTKGATMVFPGEGFDPARDAARAVAAERCTALYGVPTMFVAMLDHPASTSSTSRPSAPGIMAGAPCPIEVMKQVVAQMHMAEVTIAYGMTETSPVSFQSATDDPLEKRVSTVGRVHPHVEVQARRRRRARPCRSARRGELCTRGYSVMKRLLGRAGEDRARRSTRTAGCTPATSRMLDAEGYCNIVGRVKDMLIRGGENVYPREIEEFLFRHPAVAEVQVFGVPDPNYGEEVARLDRAASPARR